MLQIAIDIFELCNSHAVNDDFNMIFTHIMLTVDDISMIC